MKVCLGGTFNIIHKGHELIFQKAFEGDNQVFIGLTSDELISGKKEVEIDEFHAREKRLIAFLNGMGWEGRFTISKLTDELGPAKEKDFDAIIVSEETIAGAEAINLEREKKSLKPLKIHPVKMAFAENGDIISSTRIKKGEMDVNGKLMKRVLIYIGSENQVKIKAVENVFSKLFRRVSVKGIRVDSNVPEQPKEKDVIKGAIKRATDVLDSDCDFGVGIEAGLFFNEVEKKYFDVQYCAIIDKRKRITLGHGGGFIYPDEIINLINQGKTVGQAIEEMYGIKDVGRKNGAIGFLSKDLLNRTKLTEQAVLMALIPRIRSELYERE
jgi:inosine/xanthosine triphosphatase